jgi:hypothetical protein
MNLNDFGPRFNHALNRPSDATRRLRRRLVLKIAGVDLSKQTELQYIEVENFESKILVKRLISNAEEVSLGEESDFWHNFDSKFQVELSNVILNTENNLVYLIKSNGKEFRLLKESSEWPSDRNLVIAEKPPSRNLPTIKFAKIGLPRSGFFHLITEDLPALLMNDSNWPTLNFKANSDLVLQILNSLDLKVIEVPRWIKVENFSFVTHGYDLGYLHPLGFKSLSKFSKETFLEALPKEIIYVSRVGTRRSLLGEEKIVNYLESKGFRIIKAEDHTFKEQLEIFRNANILIGVHGAGLTHGIWSVNSKLIELMPTNRVNRCFEWQTRLIGNDYQRILFEADKPDIESIIRTLDSLVR